MKKTLAFILFAFATLAIHSQSLTVGSYNIRNDNKGDVKRGDGWQQRCPIITNLIQFHDFDILGAQEVKHNQLMDMLAGLPDYAYVGVGRIDGKTEGEYSAILYKKDKFKKLDEGTFWLSEIDDQPSKGWDASVERVCSWAHLQDKKSKKKFWFFNLHMDHLGVVARKESAKLVLSKIKEMCGKEAVILTGDFNVNEHTESYKLLRDSGIFQDCYETAKVRYALTGTFNGFDANITYGTRIDHIFVSPSFEVKKYGILTDSYRAPKLEAKKRVAEDPSQKITFKDYEIRLPSDHFPLFVELAY